MTTSYLRPGWVSCFAVAAAFSTPAVAQLDYGVTAGASYSDNVLRSEFDEESSGAAVVGVELRGERPTGRLRYNVFGDLEYRDYFESGVESATYGRLLGESSYALVPETFEWMLSGSFDQAREDLLRPAAPGNLEDVVTVSTGPRVTGRFGDALEAQAQAHYTMTEYSERPFDSETTGAVVTLGRRMSPRNFIGAGASYDDVTYSSSTGAIVPDFERREYFLRFNTSGARTTLEADVGYAELSGDDLDESGPMARVRLRRQVTPSVAAFVGYVREFPTSDPTSVTPIEAEGGVTDDASLLTAGPREAELAEAGVNFGRQRMSGSIVYSRSEETSLTDTSVQRDIDRLHASVTRLVTTRSSVSFYGSYTQEEFTDQPLVLGGDEAEELELGSELNLAFGRAFGVDFRVEYHNRDSEVVGGSYSEFGVGVFVRYGSAVRFRQPGATTP